MALTRRDVLRLAGGAAIALPLASCRRLGSAQAVPGSTGAVLRSHNLEHEDMAMMGNFDVV